VEARQKLQESKEKEEDEEKRESINEDAPGNFHWRRYALFCYCVTHRTALPPQSGHVTRRPCSCSSLLGCRECTRLVPYLLLPCQTIVHVTPFYVQSKRGKLVRAVSTVSWLKQHVGLFHALLLSFHAGCAMTLPKSILQLHGPSEEEEVSQKYPSFELVLNFVKNEAMSMEKVQSLMQQRSTLASHVAQVYSFVAEYIRIIGMPNVFEVGPFTAVLM
jgi:hypothetical protein